MALQISYMFNFVRNHPLVSCFIVFLFTPPAFRLLLFFSPLLVSTALCVLALVSLGPHLTATEGTHNKREKGDNLHDPAVGDAPGYWQLGIESAAKKFEDHASDKKMDLIKIFELRGLAWANDFCLDDNSSEDESTGPAREWFFSYEDRMSMKKSRNHAAVAFQKCWEQANEEGIECMEDGGLMANDTVNQVFQGASHGTAACVPSQIGVGDSITSEMVAMVRGKHETTEEQKTDRKVKKDVVCKESIEVSKLPLGNGSSKDNLCDPGREVQEVNIKKHYSYMKRCRAHGAVSPNRQQDGGPTSLPQRRELSPGSLELHSSPLDVQPLFGETDRTPEPMLREEQSKVEAPMKPHDDAHSDFGDNPRSQLVQGKILKTDKPRHRSRPCTLQEISNMEPLKKERYHHQEEASFA